MEIAGCFVGQIKAAWLVGRSGIFVWVVVASIATQANETTRTARGIISSCVWSVLGSGLVGLYYVGISPALSAKREIGTDQQISLDGS